MDQKPYDIYVDADAMPRTAMAIVRNAARQFGARVTTVSSIRHEHSGDDHVTVDHAPDSADYEILRRIGRDRPCLVVTQDYGLAALALARSAKAISPIGRIYTHENIDLLLAERALHAKLRRSPKVRVKGQGPRPRTLEDDERFEQALLSILSAPLHESD